MDSEEQTKVRLVAYTQPTKEFYIESNGMHTLDDLVAYFARVSNPSNQYNQLTAPRLLEYLTKQNHWSPFEMVSATLEISTTRAISHQIVRHRSFAFQEFCIAAQSKVLVIRSEGGSSSGIFARKIPIVTMYFNQGREKYTVPVYDPDIKDYVTAQVKEIFQTGIKPVFRVILKDGSSIESTKEHKFFSKSGKFVRLKHLTANDAILVADSEIRYSDIVSIEYMGEKMTYDLEVNHHSHNYIANAIVTHNSQRYADPTKDMEFVTYEARLQDTKNRQNSIDIDRNEARQREVAEEFRMRQMALHRQIKRDYAWAIENNIAKEQARALLPESMGTRLYMSGTLRSWIHYIDLRMGNGTQREHMQVARGAYAAILPLCKSLKFLENAK